MIKDQEKSAANATTKRRGSPNDVDRYVGARVNTRRVELDISQTRLGKGLNLSFQQVQKYEIGTNRISSGTLYIIAQLLSVSVDYFFEGIEWKDGKPVVPAIPPRVRVEKKLHP